MTRPSHINPLQWTEALGLARQACARVFRNGGAPADALSSFGLTARGPAQDWSKAVEAIAVSVCSRRLAA
jgi:hypothetical protein